MKEQNTDFGAALEVAFGPAADLSRRELVLGGAAAVLYFIDGLTSGADVAETVLRPLSRLPAGTPEDLYRAALAGTVYNATAKPCPDPADGTDKLLNGFSLLWIPGAGALVCETRTGEKRNPGPPEVENTAKGPKDAFTETLRTNTGLLRRHLRTADLGLWETTVGTACQTPVALVWLRSRADPALTAQIRRRLETMDPAGLVTPAALEETLTGSRNTAFPLAQTTERTDRLADALLRGRAGVLVDGFPVAWLLPVCLGDLMEAAEDRTTLFPAATLVRILRYAALLLALLLPGLYIALAEFHQEMIPTALLTAMIESKRSVPFPAVLEVLGLLGAFEILQEAGTAMPQTVAQSVSIIGGLVVGTAAVQADLISPTALIVVAAAGICSYALPGKDLADGVRVWRLILAAAAALGGLFGLTLAALGLILRLASLESLGRSWLDPFSRLRGAGALVRTKIKEDTSP